MNLDRPTYRPAASLLDVVATNQSDRVVRAGVTRCHLGGPHDYTRIMIRQGRDSRAGSGVIVHRRCLGRIDVTEFNVTLSRADWNEVWTSGSTEGGVGGVCASVPARPGHCGADAARPCVTARGATCDGGHP